MGYMSAEVQSVCYIQAFDFWNKKNVHLHDEQFGIRSFQKNREIYLYTNYMTS